MPSRLAVALFFGLVAGCYRSHRRHDEVACTLEPTSGCVAWEVAGPPVLVSERTAGGGPRYGSAVPLDCGVLVAWGIGTFDAMGSTTRHATRTLDWSGSPTAPEVDHPALRLEAAAVGPASLARGVDGVAMVIASGEEDCLFVALDDDGHERSAVVRRGSGSSCGDLVATPSGWSWISSRTGATLPMRLVEVDPGGTELARADLFAPSMLTRWSRVVSPDGSFLGYSSSEDFITMTYESRLRRFDAAGIPLGPELQLGEPANSVVLAGTADGVLAAWVTPDGGMPLLRVRPLDALGAATGPPREVPAEGPRFGLGLATTPDGDVVLAWNDEHWDGGPEYTLHIAALAPDGTLRGPPTSVAIDVAAREPQILLEPSGARGLVLSTDNDTGVYAQPITCVR